MKNHQKLVSSGNNIESTTEAGMKKSHPGNANPASKQMQI
jgi:hypothetical protein